MSQLIEYRPATEQDLPGIHLVWFAASPFDAFDNNPWFGHVLRTGSMMVATLENRVIGFAGVRRVGEASVVSDCFVDPGHQGDGIGSSLLSRLLPQTRPAMTLASSDPRARALYARFGMSPRWDCHYVEGDPARLERWETMVAEVERYPVAESDLPHLRDDLRCTFLEAGTGIAAVSVGSVESSLVPPAGDPVEVLSAILGWMAARGDQKVNLHLSDQHPLLSVLIGVGFAVTGTDTLMASEGAKVPDPTRITFNGDILRIGL
jgi:GNAT superfamily N-acetyltransferase